MQILPEVPDKSVDILVTDPPYSIGTTSNGTRGSWLDNNSMALFNQWFAEVARVLKPGADFYINTDCAPTPFCIRWQCNTC